MRIGSIPDGFWDSVSMRAAEPQIVYVGPMPERPQDYYAAARRFAPELGQSAFVYLLLGCDGALIYAGKARNPGNRFDKHRRRDWWDEVYNLCLIRVRGATQAEADVVAFHVERLAIQQLDPIYNIAGIKRRPGHPRGVFA